MLFKNATIVTMNDAQQVLHHACLWTKGERIAYIGDEKGLPMEAHADEWRDASEKLLLPGLVNTHNHVAMTLFRGYADDLTLHEWLTGRIWPMEEKLNGEAAYAGALLGCAEMLQNGVTCFSDMYFFMEDVAKAVEESGIRGVLSWAVLDKPDMMERIHISRDYHRRFHGSADGRITVALGPHAIYTCSAKLLEQVVCMAEELDVKIHIHISETQKEVDDCVQAHGCSPVAYLDSLGVISPRTLGAHCVALSAQDIALMAQRGAHVLHCPSSNLKLGSGIAPVAHMLREGVNVTLGTDGAASNNRLDVFSEMRTSALLQKGITGDASVLSAHTSLSMATRNGARALGVDAGVLAVGRLADVVMVDLNAPYYHPRADVYASLVYGGCARDVVLTMVNGNVLYENGEFLSLDIQGVYKTCGEIAERICG
jgi:5-methylthioadenosine/S-adenosylhomocysteine deaminase